MGLGDLVTDFFGGTNYTPPPPQLTEYAGKVGDLADSVAGLYRQGIGHAQGYVPQIAGAFGRSAGASQAAGNFAQRAAQTDLLGQYNMANRLGFQSLGELSRAGSAPRQARAANLAEADFNRGYGSAQGQQHRQLARMGVRAGSGMYSMPSSLDQALGRATAGNQARFRERAYGEQQRLNALPLLNSYFGRTVAGLTGAADAYGQQGQRLAGAAGAPALALGQYLPFQQQAAQNYGQGFDMFQGGWSADQNYRHMQSAANNKMYGNILETAAGTFF